MDRELGSLRLLIGVLEFVDVLGDACCIKIIGDNIGGEVDNIERIWSWREGALGSMCIDGVNGEGTATAFDGFMELTIMPQQLVNGLGAGVDYGSGVV